MRRGGYARETAEKALTSDTYETFQVCPLEVRFTFDAGFCCVSCCCLFPRPLTVCAQKAGLTVLQQADLRAFSFSFGLLNYSVPSGRGKQDLFTQFVDGEWRALTA